MDYNIWKAGIAILMAQVAFKQGDSMIIKPITDPVNHAEGPVWDVRSHSLVYVDTFKATILSWSYATGRVRTHKFEDYDSIGMAIPVQNTSDQYIIGADRDVFKFTWPESILSRSSSSKLLRVDQNKPTNQFNDGKADSNGRLWLGTLTRNADLSVDSFGGSLYMISGNNYTDAQIQIDNTSISNGLDWSKDLTKFFYIDSETHNVDVYDYDANTGKISNRNTLFDLKEHPEFSGIPDGMTADAEDNLWVALFGGKHVLKIDSNTGKILQKIEMPATYVTSACFGGPNLDTLFITTSRMKLNAWQLEKEPSAGSVFAIENLGVTGKSVNEAVI